MHERRNSREYQCFPCLTNGCHFLTSKNTGNGTPYFVKSVMNFMDAFLAPFSSFNTVCPYNSGYKTACADGGNPGNISAFRALCRGVIFRPQKTQVFTPLFYEIRDGFYAVLMRRKPVRELVLFPSRAFGAGPD